MKLYIATFFAAAMFLGSNVMAGSAAAPYDNSRIDGRLNVTVAEDTDVVHFVRDNADPNVVTKAYVVKHVDAYELRSYLRNMVQTRKVSSNNTNVEAVRFSDGTSILLVSAEEYRFSDSSAGQGIDSIISELDKPRLVSSSGRVTYIYSPKYRSAQELMEMVNEVGAYSRDLTMGRPGGNDVMAADPGLNLIFFTTAPFSRRAIMEVLQAYDQPYPEVRARITVYELYAENDTKLGVDFQTWKNNDGASLFRTGGRFSQNSNVSDLVRGRGWNETTYFKFNPKWNTKYLDFLTSIGKARVMHTSEMTLRNNTTGVIEKYTQVFVPNAHAAPNGDMIESFLVYGAAAGEVVGFESDGTPIVVSAATQVTIIKLGRKTVVEYTLRLDENSAATFVCNGKQAGKVTEARSIPANLEAQLVSNNFTFNRGNAINLLASDKFGFLLELTPSVTQKATTLNVKVSNSSLIGYTSEGEPRIQKGAEIDTVFTISNEGTKLVIGGIEKRSVVRVSGGLPLLKDLPVIGWIFSTETEATKRSQLVVVAEVVPEANGVDYRNIISDIQGDLTVAGEKNSFGFHQYLIDPDRR